MIAGSVWRIFPMGDAKIYHIPFLFFHGLGHVTKLKL